MSVRAALEFIRQVRDDEALKDRIQALDCEASLEDLVEIGSQAGLAFTIDELRSAHEHDWSMRWVHYGSRNAVERA